MSHTNPTETEDFVLVENDAETPPLQDSPSDSDYAPCSETNNSVRADDDNSTSSGSDTVEGDVSMTSGDESEEVMLKIECFAPMRRSGFPEEFTKHALISPARAFGDGDEDPWAPEPATVLLGNAEVLFLACVHFEEFYSKLGNDSYLYLIGKACRLKIDDPVPIRRRVNQAINTLIEGRLASSGPHLASATNEQASNLAYMVDEYIAFDKPDPSELLEKWHEDWEVGQLWDEWQRLMEPLEDPEIFDRPRHDKPSIAASRASTILLDTYTRLETCVESGTLHERDRLQIQRALDFAETTTKKIKYALDYKYLPM
ncbi:hypothetical protein Daus18300_004830 [Diaporthe australafricana]|uniref:Uncharacterized protein n=1 Tax=Diaporthe australafricana TaxID=127596 RepID=A0ABR3X5H5_9PEZI